MRPFWHRLSKKNQLKVLNSGITVGHFVSSYRQPRWCDYPEALASVLGCWSLMTPGKIRSIKNCYNCSLCKREAERQR